MEEHRQTAHALILNVAVVDNASSDDSAGMVHRDFPDCQIVTNTHNRGFAAAVNQGIAMGTSPLILLLNSDACLSRGDITRLCTVMETHPDIALLGCRIATPAGRPERSCGAFPAVLAGTLDRIFPWVPRTYRNPSVAHNLCTVDWVSGVCCLVRRSALSDIHSPG